MQKQRIMPRKSTIKAPNKQTEKWMNVCNYIYSTEKGTRKFITLKLINKIKYVEFKKYIFHVKQTVYYTVSFTCNIHFLNSTYFIFNQFKSNKFSHFFCCWIYIFKKKKRFAQVISYWKFKDKRANHTNPDEAGHYEPVTTALDEREYLMTIRDNFC